SSLATEWGRGIVVRSLSGRIGELGMGNWEWGIGNWAEKHWALGIGNGEWGRKALGIGNSFFFPLPSSFFPLPSSLFLLPSSRFCFQASRHSERLMGEYVKINHIKMYLEAVGVLRMSKRSSIESPNQSSSTPIKPVLQAALGCLEVNLEAELTKYRRHRRRAEQWVSPSIRPGKQTGTTDQQLGQNLPAAAEETQQSIRLPLSLAGSAGDAPLATTRISKATKLSSSAGAPNNYLESSEKLIESLDQPTAELSEERSLAASLLTPLGLSSMLLFLLSCTALGYAVMHPSSVVKMAGLNRLFVSSAPGVAESPTSRATTNTGNNKELPKAPNLVSKEFVELDLSTLSNVEPTASPIASPSPKASIPPTPAVIPTETGAVPIPTEDGNKARGREQGLNNLSTALLPGASPSAAQPVPTLPTLPPTSSTLPPAAVSPAAVSPAVVSPAATSGTPAATLGRPARAADGFYYVVVDYTDEKSLQQARIAVPDAYVRNFSKGVKIQMGALNDAASAERLAKELQAKGVKPQYYQP
ncbi:MAG: hypothetical protein WCD53_21310, partial [Microcoleus sp.]